MKFLLIFIGGGFGSLLRFIISRYLNTAITSFPYGTFAVNISGCLLMGILLGLTLKNNLLSPTLLPLFIIGFCGGFTTFSAFAYENYMFLKSGEFFLFTLYTMGSILIGFAAVFFGMWIVKSF